MNLLRISLIFLGMLGFTQVVNVYEVSIPAGSNPHQHPDIPEAAGPVAPRTLKYLKNFTLSKIT